jgi:ribosomal protein L12E/L44/L45/RPP1/RPP2
MKHVAAVLLLALGNKEISKWKFLNLDEANLNAVLSSVGVKSNPAAVKLILAACKGKKPQEVN